MIIANEKAVYHVMSRTALDGFPLKDVEKDFMLGLIKRFSSLYFTEILGFCLMGNHFHLLVKMIPENRFTDEEIQKRFDAFYGDSRSALLGTTTGAITAEVIFGETDSKALLLIEAKR
jgi:REP element-mobilizing transposase RayT